MLTQVERDQLVTARQVEGEMLATRGYEVDDVALYQAKTYDALLELHGSPETVAGLAENLSSSFFNVDKGEKIVIRYVLEPPPESAIPYLMGLSPDIAPTAAGPIAASFRDLRADLVQHHIVSLTNLIISLPELTPTYQSQLMGVAQEEIPWKVELFQLKELQMNPLDHVFAPKYYILSEEEVEKLGVARWQQPEQKVSYRQRTKRRTDAQCGSIALKFMGIRNGTVLRVQRRNISSLAGEYRYTYCVCIETNN